MNTDRPSRDPLTVPVADATIAELAAQARAHVIDSAYATLEEFQKHSTEVDDTFRILGTDLTITRITQEKRTITDTLQTLWLCKLPDGSSVMVIRPSLFGSNDSYDTGGSYGTIGPDHGLIIECTIEDLHCSAGADVIRNAARVLNSLKLQASLKAAMDRVASDS